MIKLTIATAGREIDYSQWVVWGSVKITEQINASTSMSFQLKGTGADFLVPIQRAYVRVYSTQYDKSLFTGYIVSEPSKDFDGLSARAISANHGQMISFTVNCMSDDHILNIKSVPFIPAYINRTQGKIIKDLAQVLCPNMYNTDNVADGDLVPFYQYDSSKSFIQVAGEFGNSSRYRFKARDKKLFYQPYGDAKLGVSYNEDLNSSTFDALGLKTTVMTVPLINDVTVIGDVEAGNNRDDYFLGDGFTSNFALRHKVFKGSSNVLLQDDWSATTLNDQQWDNEDPNTQFDFSQGALNIVSTVPNADGTSYMATKNGVELAGGLNITHGEFTFQDTCSGTIGGLYADDSAASGSNYNASGCLGGFNIYPSPAVQTSASGAAGLIIQPQWNGIDVGPPIVSQSNHTYVLETIINSPSYTRWKTTYRTIDGEEYGGTSNDVTGTIAYVIQDYDIAAATGAFYDPVVTRSSIQNVDMPDFALYALVNNIEMNVTVRSTQITQTPLGSLQANVGPSGLFMPTGGILPMLPPGNASYPGPVAPYATDASGNIVQSEGYLASGGLGAVLQGGVLQGWVPEILGSGLELQTAQITSGNNSDTLGFYGDTIPAAGTPIRLQTWEAQAAVSRVQDPDSIANEAYVVGDDGVRGTIVSNLSPLPRTSEDADHAAVAYLADRGTPTYNGSYTFTSQFLDVLSADYITDGDDTFWPTVGRFLYVNAPPRGIVDQKMLVTGLTFSPTEPVREIITYNLTFGADLRLEKTLRNFVDQKPASILTSTDTATKVDPKLIQNVTSAIATPDIANAMAVDITGTEVQVAIFDTLAAGTTIEVRNRDTNWGMVTADLIGSYPATGNGVQYAGNGLVPLVNQATSATDGSATATTYRAITADEAAGLITLARTGYDQTWYMRPVSAAKVPSRRSKVIRVMYPLLPSSPNVVSVDSNFMQLDYNGDVRNIYGVEIRDSNNTVLVQKPVFSYGDLNIDITQTASVQSGNRDLQVYFFNAQWEYSDPTSLSVGAPDPPNLTEGLRFSQALTIESDTLTRTDIIGQHWQVAQDIGFNSVLVDVNYSSQTGVFNTTVPASSDVYVRSNRSDYLGTSDWSNTLKVPMGDLIASDYLTTQGSTALTTTNSAGSIFTYAADGNSIIVSTIPFTITYPNGQVYTASHGDEDFTQTLDTKQPLTTSTGYLFYFSMQSLAYASPQIKIDGPYAATSPAALTRQSRDGHLPLSNGALTFFTAGSATGNSGGGGGGSQGGGNCGVATSMLLRNDGKLIPLSGFETGWHVQTDGSPIGERLNAKQVCENTEVWTLQTPNFRTRVGVAHTFLTERGWAPLYELVDMWFDGEPMPRVKTVAGWEDILYITRKGYEPVVALSLEGPDHVYVLDGFYNHNYIYKDGRDPD